MTEHTGSTAEEIESPFQPVLAARASDEVVDQLCHAVHTGRFEVGARLPRLDELAAAMSVSIPTVSEAVRVLEHAGVLRVRRGSHGGISVASSLIPPEILTRLRPVARNLRELTEARRPVEMTLAVLAAERATEHDFEEIRSAIRMQEEAPDIAGWTFGNFKFHYAIGRAAGSTLLFHFQTEITKEMSGLLSELWTPRDRENPAATIAEHKAILSALETRDQKAVEDAVNQHLLEIEALAAEDQDE
jgi:GntR family transcriptional repressor for pyruvate dehydrogenase complex